VNDAFPPYELLHAFEAAATEKTKKLERLYHQTQAHSWNPQKVLDELVTKHGGIHVPEDKKAAIGHVFAIILWGELAAWNIAADLARSLPDVDAKMAATGQVFDEARHFTVLRDYLVRAKVDLPPLNVYGRRILTRILETRSLLRKLYGMQLLVETMALAIFKRVKEARFEPVLADLLEYVERDESRHVALGVMYLPKLLARTTRAERLGNWAFNMELFALSMAGGRVLDPHFNALGIDHRELSLGMMRLHQQVIRKMADEHGTKRVEGVYGLSARQQLLLVDTLYPKELPPMHAWALGRLDKTLSIAARALA
jgi:hypothetical protein